MVSGMSDEELYQIAKKRVEEKRGFFVHLSVYVVVNIVLVLIWALTDRGGGFPWFVFPLGGWGIGIVFHFLGVFVFSRPDRERREIEKEMERLRKGGN